MNLNLTSTIDIKTAQEIYDNGNDRVKEIISNIFPEYILKTDTNNVDKRILHGRNKECLEQGYTEYILVKRLKNKIRFKNCKYWEENISEDLYNELYSLDDNTPVLAIWYSPRDDYGDSPTQLIGFYELNERGIN